ncbi:Rieske 2Fe-2S domain-containing protein [Streptomyces sp. NPDC051662]|uniref:Rieske 2Fe-2S domain-containing protein n=1 Tax=Streptomyces sp. NPDC051662 TaxID=3154750 RepID=UPI0034207FC3
MAFRDTANKWYTVPDQRATAADAAFPAALPNPRGWFCIGFTDEVRPGQVLTRRFVDQDVVVYRTQAGLLRVVDPYCPHLGAHLGVGGRVDGEDLVCPFHAFAFSPDGTCVRTGYGTRPPKARLGHLEIREKHGMILAWYDPTGGPTFEVPELDTEGFSPLVHTIAELPTHPQEMAENGVDTGHISVLHGAVIPDTPVYRFEGPTMYGRSTMRIKIPYVPWGSVTTTYEGEVHGLGYMFAVIHLPRLGPALRIWALPTVVGPWRIQLRCAASFALPLPGWLPSQLNRDALLAASTWLCRYGLHVTLNSLVLGPDTPIWHTKQYQSAPRLAEGDGPIGRYRRWARQFYSTPPPSGHGETPEHESPVPPA